MQHIHKRLNAVFQKLIDDPVVEFHRFGVDLPHAVRNQSGPGDGEPERILTGLLHIVNIRFILVIEKATVIGHIIRHDLTNQFLTGTGKILPCKLSLVVFHHVFAFAIPVNGTLRLKRGLCRAKQKILRKPETIIRYIFHFS